MKNLQNTHGWNRILAYTIRTNRRKRHATKAGVNGGLIQKQPQQEGVTQLNYITIINRQIRREGGKTWRKNTRTQTASSHRGMDSSSPRPRRKPIWTLTTRNDVKRPANQPITPVAFAVFSHPLRSKPNF